jgi:uncharacterized protein YegP (UPF0339 family)
MAAKFDISKDYAGKYRFHLKAPNGEIIAASQGYETKANAEKGIEAIKTHATNAKVEGHTSPNPVRALPIHPRSAAETPTVCGAGS